MTELLAPRISAAVGARERAALLLHGDHVLSAVIRRRGDVPVLPLERARGAWATASPSSTASDSYRVQTSAPPRGEFPITRGVTVHRLESRLGRLSPLVTYLTGRPGLKAPALGGSSANERFDVVHFHLDNAVRPGNPALRR